MEIRIAFGDGTEITKSFTDAEEKALFVDIVNPEEWIENAVYQKARKVIENKLIVSGISIQDKTKEEIEQAFLDLNLPDKADEMIQESGELESGQY